MEITSVPISTDGGVVDADTIWEMKLETSPIMVMREMDWRRRADV